MKEMRHEPGHGRARALPIALACLLALGGAAAAGAADRDQDGVEDEADNCLELPNPGQEDTDDDQFGNRCDADLNDDGIVNFGDLAEMRRVFLTRDPDADLNSDGIVNFGDVAILRQLFLRDPGPSGPLPAVLPVYETVKEGLSRQEAEGLAGAFGVPARLLEDGSVHFVSEALGDVPMREVQGPDATELPRDEDGQDTVARAFDLEGIRKLVPVEPDAARDLLVEGFRQAGVRLPGEGTDRDLHVSHTTLSLFSRDGATDFSQPIDTALRFDFWLDGRPLLGPGAKVAFSWAPSGEVTSLVHSMRELQPAGEARLESPFAARDACARFYPRGSQLKTPRLVYWSPGLERSVRSVFPHWECRGTSPQGGALVSTYLPAVQAGAPVVGVEVGITGGSQVSADATVQGGTPPYTYSWQSLTTDLSGQDTSEPSLFYEVRPRGPVSTELLVLTVTDSNGLVGKGSRTLEVGAARLAADGAGATPVPRSLGVVDVGGEFNVYEWNCVKQSSSGFSAAFGGQGVPVQFNWKGNSAWERDFRESGPPQDGDDADWVDDVDLAWYTGHGNPGAFYFDNDSRDDGSIVPGDARWGNRDLEWMQLESCNVLQFDSGGTPIWERWARVFDGLHLLNGFQSLANCVDTPNGTAGRFSRYLFRRQILFVTLPALKVRQAWAQMAKDLEPSGREYVTMGAASSGWVTNYDDYFWGEGPVGPDIPEDQIIGYWWLKGEV